MSITVTDSDGAFLKRDMQSAALGVMRAKEARQEGGAMAFRMECSEALFARALKDSEMVQAPLWCRVLNQYGYDVRLRDDGFDLYDLRIGGSVKSYEDDPYRSGLKYLLKDVPVSFNIDVTGQEFPEHMQDEEETPGALLRLVEEGDFRAPLEYQKFLVEKRRRGTYGQGVEGLYGASRVEPIKLGEKTAKLFNDTQGGVQLGVKFARAKSKKMSLQSFVNELRDWTLPLRLKTKILENPEYRVTVSNGVKKRFKSDSDMAWASVDEVPDDFAAEFLVHALRLSIEQRLVSDGDTREARKKARKKAKKRRGVCEQPDDLYADAPKMGSVFFGPDDMPG